MNQLRLSRLEELFGQVIVQRVDVLDPADDAWIDEMITRLSTGQPLAAEREVEIAIKVRGISERTKAFAAEIERRHDAVFRDSGDHGIDRVFLRECGCGTCLRVSRRLPPEPQSFRPVGES
jgi:hypothetical protein